LVKNQQFIYHNTAIYFNLLVRNRHFHCYFDLQSCFPLYDQKAACGKAGVYELAEQFDDAAISVSTTGETKFTVKVTFTSFLMREENVVSATAKPDPPDVLPKRKCLDALAKLRHSKWYQVSCVDSQRDFRNCCE
jgi:hypothetical protein